MMKSALAFIVSCCLLIGCAELGIDERGQSTGVPGDGCPSVCPPGSGLVASGCCSSFTTTGAHTLLLSGLDCRSNGSTQYVLNAGFLIWNGSTSAMCPFALHVGDVIKAVHFTVIGDNFVDASASVYKTAGASTENPLGTWSRGNVEPTLVSYTIDAADTTLAPGDFVYLQISTGGPGLQVGSIQVVYD
jgi:hypothetical protein